MQHANIAKAVEYLNVLAYGNKYSKFVTLYQLKKCKPGHIGFIVYKTRFPGRDTVVALKRLMISSLGRKPDVGYESADCIGYTWVLELPTRQLHVEYRKGIGTFIELTDTGS